MAGRHQRAVVDEDWRLRIERKHPRSGFERQVRRSIEERLHEGIATDERVHRIIHTVRHVADAVAVRIVAAVLRPTNFRGRPGTSASRTKAAARADGRP